MAANSLTTNNTSTILTAQDIMKHRAPKSTRSYKAVSHKELILTTREALDKQGFKIFEESYNIAHDGAVATGKYCIKHDNAEMGIMCAWQNSYNRRVALKFALGAQVFICSNGMVSGDMNSFRRKHTGDVKEFTPAQIFEYVKEADETFQLMNQERLRLRDIAITKRTQAELLGRMFIEQEIITANQLGIIKKEIEAPTHDYKAEGSMWELYNHTTFALKEANAKLWLAQHTKVHDFLTSAV